VSLLSEQDRRVVREHLATIQQPVTLLLFTQTIGAPESALIARQVLDELASLNDLIRVEESNFILEKDRASQYGVDRIPAIVLLSGENDTRMRFLGAPAGYEFMSLVEAVILAGTNDSQLDPESRALIAANVSAPVDIQVFVTPTCPHCPRAVSLAHRMARESAHIRATCVEATEFMDLSRKFRVTGVPKIVVNESIEILGALPEELFVRGVLGLPEEDPPPSA